MYKQTSMRLVEFIIIFFFLYPCTYLYIILSFYIQHTTYIFKIVLKLCYMLCIVYAGIKKSVICVFILDVAIKFNFFLLLPVYNDVYYVDVERWCLCTSVRWTKKKPNSVWYSWKLAAAAAIIYMSRRQHKKN